MAHLIYKEGILSKTHTLYDVPDGENLGGWIMENLPKPKRGLLKVFDGSVSFKTEIPPEEVVERKAYSGDYFIAVAVPGAEVAWWVYAALFVAAVGVAILLRPSIPEPPKPNEFANDERSPNNSITGQTNRLRVGARIPDILGKVRSWPDLLAPSYDTWAGTEQQVTEFFCVGKGQYKLEEARLGNTLLEDLSSFASAKFYKPGSTPSKLLGVVVSEQVDRIPMLAPNETDSTSTLITFDATSNALWTSIADGQLVPWEGSDYGDNASEIVIIEKAADLDSTNVGGYRVFRVVQAANPHLPGSPVQWKHSVVKTITVTQTVEVPYTLMYESKAPKDYFVDFIPDDAPGQLDFENWESFSNRHDVGDILYFKKVLPVRYGQFDSIEVDAYRLVQKGYLKQGDAGFQDDVFTFERLDGSEPTWIGHGDFDGLDGVIEIVGLTRTSKDYNQDVWVGWFTTPATDPDELWIDFQFPRGLYQQQLGPDPLPKASLKVEVDYQIQGLHNNTGEPVGPVYSVTKEYEFKSVNNLRWTEQIHIDEIFNEVPNFKRRNAYQVRVRRPENRIFSSNNFAYQDEVEWAALRSVFYISTKKNPVDFGDVTTALLTLRSSTRIASLEDRTFNVLATRKLPTYDRSSKRMTEEIYPTAKWADGFIYRCLESDGGKFSIAGLDFEGIYDLQDRLAEMDNGEAGQLNVTLDKFIDVDKELAQLADVVRAVAYRSGQVLYVARDDNYKKVPLTLYNRRNKAPNSETLKMTFKQSDGYDGIEFEYIEPSTGYKTVTFVYPDGSSPANPKKIQGFGIMNWSQAWRRAAYEWNALQLRKDYLALEVLDDPRLLSPYDLVKNVDNADIENMADGEILSYDLNTNTVILDRDVTFGAGGHTILIRSQKLDSVEVFSASQGGAANQIILGSIPTNPIIGRDDRSGGLGSLFSFSSNSADIARDYLFLEGTIQDNGYVNVSLVRYDPDVYQKDTVKLPTKPAFPITT